MARGFDKLHIKSAVKSRTPMDLSMSHLTTMDFGQIVPLYFNELVPGDKFNVNGQYFSRMAPLVKPTYGKFYFKTASFFVPMYQLADDAEAFVSGANLWEGSSPKLRYFTYLDFVYLLNQTSISIGVSSTSVYDWHFVAANGSDTYKKFTPFGKFCLKIFNSLGYAIPQNVDLQTTSSWYSSFASSLLNAMPLLAFAKAYNDYMSQSQRYNSSNLTAFLKAVKHRAAGVTGFNPSTCNIDYQGLNTLLSNINLCYENDYFTSAWEEPNAPRGYSDSINGIDVPGTGGSGTPVDAIINSDIPGANIVHNLSTLNPTIVSLSQRSLDFLKSFDDWVRRNNYAGSRIVQKVYARFGIKTEDFRSNYAHCIGTSSTALQVGDVTATSSNNVTIDSKPISNVVGDYAGKGIVNDGTGISYDSSDYGYLMILGYYTVAPMMSYGFDRSVLRTDPFDFYTPEFDGLGAQAISYGEIFANPIADSADTTLDNEVYGFTERYSDMRFGRDKITGEFRDYHPSADMNVWHSGRLLNDVRKNNQMVAQSASMMYLANSSSEYNRIFSVVSGQNDHFYLTAQFKVNAVRPMLSLNQVPRLGEGDTVVDKNGNVIN